MIETKYAVAYRAEGAADWQGLAAYPWYDDLKGAEALKVFLEKTRALPFEYAVATLTIGDARASSPDPAREALVGALKEAVAGMRTAHACATWREDGTCQGCFLSVAIDNAMQALNQVGREAEAGARSNRNIS